MEKKIMANQYRKIKKKYAIKKKKIKIMWINTGNLRRATQFSEKKKKPGGVLMWHKRYFFL